MNDFSRIHIFDKTKGFFRYKTTLRDYTFVKVVTLLQPLTFYVLTLSFVTKKLVYILW